MVRWRVEAGNPQLSLEKALGFDRSFAIPKLNAGIWPPFKPEILEETSQYVVARSEQGIVTRSLRGAEAMPEFLDYPVKTMADWERLKDLCLRWCNNNCNQEGDQYATEV